MGCAVYPLLLVVTCVHMFSLYSYMCVLVQCSVFVCLCVSQRPGMRVNMCFEYAYPC